MKDILTLENLENYLDIEILENIDFSKHNDTNPSMYHSPLLDN